MAGTSGRSTRDSGRRGTDLATRTDPLITLQGFALTVDTDDATHVVSAVHAVNTSGVPVTIVAHRHSDGAEFSHTFPAGTNDWAGLAPLGLKYQPGVATGYSWRTA